MPESAARPDEPALRVLLLVPSMQGAGGTERVVFNLARLLGGMGHKVAVASFDAPGDPQHFAVPAQRIALGPFKRRLLALRPFEYVSEARALARAKRLFQPEVTISNLWRADLISQISGGSDAKIALAHINVVGNPSNRAMIALRPLVAAIYRRFAKVIAVTAPLAAELKALYRLPDAQIAAIDNFSDPPTANPCLPDDGVRRLVWCGRLVTEKNLAGLLPLWAEFCTDRSEVQLVVLGDGPLLGELTAQATALGLKLGATPSERAANLIFAGVVSNPADYMVSGQALVLSSLAEGMPMVLLEALALGTPILAADCPAGGVRAALAEGPDGEAACGALLPIPRVEDPASRAAWLPWLARAVDDPGEVARWRQGALARAVKFSSATAAGAWQAALAEVTA